jgi:hypothetical protein
MTMNRRGFLRLAGLATAAAAANGAVGVPGGMAPLWGGMTAYAQPPGDASPISPALHVLNRVTWGARADHLARINEIGVEAYIDWQLDYANIADPMIDAFVAGRRVLSMEYGEIARLAAENYGLVLEVVLNNRVYRAIYSERQLYERMVEFWTDHFNIPIGDYLVDKALDDREVIRPHALGRFRDLLFASASSPAMLRYLDNAVSSKEHPNENYARELMELHTLGVDGGYTEADVVEVARALTGWTVYDTYPGRFVFNADNHDTDEKVVLGHVLPAGRGIEDGLQVLDILARHPSTARFISFKLIRRFVSDQPPDALVESAAAVFTATDGDLKAVLRHILLSPEFNSAVGQKFRRPLDFVAAMGRALTPGLIVEDAMPLIYGLEPLGQLPYFWNPPNGYPDVAGAWINTNALLNRWNGALLLALAGEGYADGLVLNLDQVVPQVATVGELIDAAALRVLGRPLPEANAALLTAYVVPNGDANSPLDPLVRNAKLPGVVGLLMASPYFQWY